MKLNFNCPKCQNPITIDKIEEAKSAGCRRCKREFPLHSFPDADPRELRQCLLCETKDLYIQKKFPAKLGLGIVAAAAVITLLWDHKYYFTLLATALIDWALYKKCPNVMRCYLCHAEYAGFIQLPDRTGFDLNTYERYRRSSWGGTD